MLKLCENVKPENVEAFKVCLENDLLQQGLLALFIFAVFGIFGAVIYGVTKL